MTANHHKGKKGLRRLANAVRYSLAGFAAAWRHEEAFRIELLLCAVLAPAAWMLGQSAIERVLLLGSLFLVLVVELLNSALEAAVDHTSLAAHPLAARAKDMASAAVMLSLVAAGTVWLFLLLG